MIDRFSTSSLDLSKLGNLTIARSFFSGEFDSTEIHVFGDSSQEVFSAVAILRAKVRSGTTTHTEIAFILGKARVAPMNCLIVPKPELQAALLATRLKVYIYKALKIPLSKTFIWTDSTTVLQWLRSFDKQPIFIANRVSEILESTTVDQWFHVPSADNSADAGTRGMSADGLCASSWLKRPIFLFTSNFPFQPIHQILGKPLNSPLGDSAEKQESSLASIVSYEEKLFNYTKFSSYFKLVRITAYRLCILPNHAPFRSSDASICRPEEIQVAEAKRQFLVQSESFSFEKKQLLDEKHLARRNPISPYTLFIGPNALIRSSGRITVEADYDIKHSILLDRCHPAVSPFLKKEHLVNYHEGADFLRACIQGPYTVLKLCSALRSIKFNCVLRCKRSESSVQPMMADLPAERLSYGSPSFFNTGKYYFGPFHVSVKRSSEKRWGLLLTCLTTRALHNEVVPSMDMNSWVMGNESFIAWK